MQQGTDPSRPEGVWILSKASKLHATTTETLWACIQAQVLPSPKGCIWKYEHLAVLWTPCRFYPPGVACSAEGGMADFRTTTSGAAPTSPPEVVFRSIRRKKCRRAVGTHYGPTRSHQAGYSPLHWRDDYETPLFFAFYDRTQALLSDDYGPAGAAGAWATQIFICPK